MSLPPIKTYEVSVDTFQPVIYRARTRGKALGRAFRDFTVVHDCSFRDFLGFARIQRIENPPGVGNKILVNGKPATTIVGLGSGHYVHFIFDDGNTPLVSHPLDVQPTPPEARKE